jgi:Ribbon-helix-helix protein, copG family
MKKSIEVAHKKGRGRPSTGKDPHMAARMPPALIAEVEAWAAANDTSRSEAFRRLVELGLKAKK